MVKIEKDRGASYRPVQAASVTGLFPGFARPHFLPDHVDTNSWNTVYVQRVLEEEIVSFEPLVENFAPAFFLPNEGERVARPGDKPIYVYAFGPNDAAVGSRSEVAAVIEKRFDEIAAREFAACTAAQFARLKDRLPSANLKAYKLLSKLNASSARQWRDTAVFLAAFRSEFGPLGIPSEAINLRTRARGKRIEIELAIVLEDLSLLNHRYLENMGRQLLLGSGLFGEKDTFSVHLQSSYGGRATSQFRLFEANELDSALREAKLFLEQRVFLPALNLNRSSKRILNVIRDTRQWISKFEKIGDLVRYMDRFKPDTRQSPLPLMKLEQVRFEDVHADFLKRFEKYRGYQTVAGDFREGERYSSFSLAIYTRTYNNRAGGIRPVGKIGNHEAVVVNITLSGGRYANEWLEEGRKLKCYMRSPQKKRTLSDDGHDANRSILKYPHVPVLVFTRNSGEGDFLYHGIFRYAQATADFEGRKFFELTKREGV